MLPTRECPGRSPPRANHHQLTANHHHHHAGTVTREKPRSLRKYALLTAGTGALLLCGAALPSSFHGSLMTSGSGTMVAPPSSFNEERMRGGGFLSTQGRGGKGGKGGKGW